MPQKQLNSQDLAARRQRVYALPSVLELSCCPRQHRDYFYAMTDVKLRSLQEPRWGIYLAESSKVIRRALAAGDRPLAFLASEKWADDLRDIFLAYPQVPVYLAQESELENLTGYRVHRGALAAMQRPAPRTLAEIVSGSSRLAVLEDIVDHANLGAIFRSAAGLGFDAIILSPSCADPLYRRSIKVSMGAVFNLPWVRSTDWGKDLQTLREQGFVLAAMALADSAMDLRHLGQRQEDKLALLLGSEGPGLSRSSLAAADFLVKIPMFWQVDSLNVATAAALAFWETGPRT